MATAESPAPTGVVAGEARPPLRRGERTAVVGRHHFDVLDLSSPVLALVFNLHVRKLDVSVPRRQVVIARPRFDRLGFLTSVGVRPTFGGRSLTVETYILRFRRDIYGEPAAVRFLRKLRDEAAYSGPEALVDRLRADRAAAERYFKVSL